MVTVEDIPLVDRRLLTVREHWSAVSGALAVAGMVVLIPLIALGMIGGALDPFLSHLLWFFYSLLFLLVWLCAGYRVSHYILSGWIITNTQIVRVEHNGFFDRRVITIGLDKIQDIVVASSGMNQSMMHTGTITIEVAAHDPFIMYNIPFPDEVERVIKNALQSQSTLPSLQPNAGAL